MKRYIFVIPLFTLLLLGCGSDSSKSSPAHESNSGGGQKHTPSKAETELEQKLESLGFQIPTEDISAIDFSLEDLSGSETSLSSFAGKVVFLNFWATWCGPCRIEIPSMEELYNEMKDEGFTIVAVNSQESVDQVSTFVQDARMSFPVLLDTTGRVGATYSVRAIPTTYIVDSQGAIRGRMVGTRDWYTPEIVSLVRELIP